MEFRILGPLEAVSEGRVLDLGGAKQRALLAVLLMHANEAVSQDRLIEALWEGAPPETARKAVQVYVSQLRKLLGADLLVTRAPGYLLRVEPGQLDLHRFETLRREARGADPSSATAKLSEALELFRGRPLADVAGERFAQGEIARLEELRLVALEERIDAELRLGRHAELVGELEALVADHPLRERLCRQRMLALYRCGRQVEALEAYQSARRALVEELGIEPGRELRELHLSILRQDQALELEAEEAKDALPTVSGAFVGREAELAELIAALDAAFAGGGGLVLVQGEPGIGKSRLAEELRSRAKGRGAWTLCGGAREAGAPPYWPWTQALRTYVSAATPSALRDQLDAGAAHVALVVPQLRGLFPGLPEPEPAEAARSRLFDWMATFLRNVALERPLVLVLEDLDAADEPSLQLLAHVAASLGESRILLVGTLHDSDPAVAGVTRRIRLGGLGAEEVARLAALASGIPLPRELAARLHAETNGNPLFVSETVRLLAAEGRLGPDGGAAVPIPQSIREVVDRRLRLLSGECRRVLSLASVFGREFGLVALERVADYTGLDKLLGVLDEAISAHVAEQVFDGVGRLRFAHELMRDTLYDEIPAVHRARLHRRVAEVLELLYAPRPDAHLAELAHHFSLAVPAGGPDKAIEYARRAGDRALASLAYEEAVRLYEQALGFVGDDPAHDELRRALEDAQAHVGGQGRSKRA